MPTSRRTVDALARRAGRRAIGPRTRADLDDALAGLDHVTIEVVSTYPAEQADAFLADLDALADEVKPIATRARG